MKTFFPQARLNKLITSAKFDKISEEPSSVVISSLFLKNVIVTARKTIQNVKIDIDY